MESKKVRHLVVDTSAFIKAAPLQDIAEEMITVQEVIDEVTSKRQLRKLVVLPYNLKVQEVFSENIKFISDFSKKTGDYTSLSATDIKVMALTYQLENERVGKEHLKTQPTTQRTVKVTGLGHFDKGDHNSSDDLEIVKEETQKSDLEGLETSIKEKLQLVDSKDNCIGKDDIAKNTDEATEVPPEVEEEDILVKVEGDDCGYEEYDTDESEDSDDGDWITPSNVHEKKKELDFGEHYQDRSVEVACITSDFAMQNVLKQIGLNVTAVDGRLIKHVRTFIFRCTTCFKTTSLMTKIFCPKCGHNTLKKVAISVDEHGNQQIHINGRKPLTARGKRFSLPTPRGGQHFQYPILTEDQHLHQRKATRLAQKKNNPLDPDYIAGFSPFTVRDVNSKSAILGVRGDKQDMKQWLRKSANDMRRKKK